MYSVCIALAWNGLCGQIAPVLVLSACYSAGRVVTLLQQHWLLVCIDTCRLFVVGGMGSAPGLGCVVLWWLVWLLFLVMHLGAQAEVGGGR